MSTARTSHMERTAQEPRNEGLHNVTLNRIDQVNERVRLFRLGLQSGPVTFSAGQWLDTYVPGIPKAGGFTITSSPSAAATVASPSQEPYLELAVQESPENAPAAWLWRPADEILGSTLQVRVGGSFVFPPAGKAMRDLSRVVFVAGGVGVNPLVSMMSSMAEGGFAGHVEVLYASKLPKGGIAEVVFFDRIAKLFDEGGLRGRLQVFATGGASSSDEQLKRARLGGEALGVEIHGRRPNHGDLRAAVGGRGERASSVVYVCGPQAMTDELVQLLTSEEGLGLDKSQVLLEKWW